MFFLYAVFVLACLGLLAAGIIEQRNHHKSLHSIPHRVLVNGIRGKSSITRLCAGALRGGKLTVVAKTTGTAARFIFPDASEEPVYRKFGIANVVEQIGIVRRAASYFPDALVIECMAVMPPLQELNQTKLIQSTIGILCNVREDHLAEMGPTLDDVARSLSRSMPVGGICVTAEKDRLHILQEEADRRKCKLIAVDPESVTDEEMRGFTWTTFKENVAIALAVAELLGVSRRDALKGMWTAPPDPGVLSVEEYRAGDKSLRFANIFAANDPESTYMNIQQLQSQGSIPRPLHVLINCRPDRVERNGQMGSLVSRIDPDKVLLIGDPTRSARVKIDDRWQDRVVDLGGKLEARELLDAVLGTIDGYASVLAIGNIHGQGELLLAQLERLERPPAGAAPAVPGQPHQRPAGAGRPDHGPAGAGRPSHGPAGTARPGQRPAGVSPHAPTEVVSARQVQAVRAARGRTGSAAGRPQDPRPMPQQHNAPPARAAAPQAPGGPAPAHRGPAPTGHGPAEAVAPRRYAGEDRQSGPADRRQNGLDGPGRYGPDSPERYAPEGPGRHGPDGPERYTPDGPGRHGPEQHGPDDAPARSAPPPAWHGPDSPERYTPDGPRRHGPNGPEQHRPAAPRQYGPDDAPARSAPPPAWHGPDSPERHTPDGPRRHGPDSPERHTPDGPRRHGPDSPERHTPDGPRRHGPDSPEQHRPAAPRQYGPDDAPARSAPPPSWHGPDERAPHRGQYGPGQPTPPPGAYGPDEPATPPGPYGPGAAAYRALAEENLSDGPVRPLPGWDDLDHAAPDQNRRSSDAPDPVDPSGRRGSVPGPPPQQRPPAYRSNR
ncbi:poly-gamma-glutamate synthase PgsB [Micromonospora sp. B11E3]|uniref:poly-gamma-glutamate synthase PgsB n=1 Tax=Micromonospora sp. B11E3 TaxID=3153562 RepID=UPI00325E26EF